VHDVGLLADDRGACQRPDVTVLLGDKNRFAAEVGEWEHSLLRVDLWAAGQWLTCDDNMAFVGQFRSDVTDTVAWLRSGASSPLPFDGLPPGSQPPAFDAPCRR
jgi:hypothetical protein